MKTASILALLFGLSLLTGLVAWQGFGTVAALLTVAGWKLLWLAPYFLVPMAIAVQCWRLLFPPGQAPPPSAALQAVWTGLAVNWLLPVAQIGGELVRARLVWKRGFPGPVSAATVVVDKTIQAMSQVAYGLIGLGLLALVARSEAKLIPGALLVVGVLGAAIYAFYRVQKAGLFGRLGRMAERMIWWTESADFAGDAARMDAELAEIYGRTRRLAASCALRMVFRFAQAGETWLALWFLGHPVGITDAVVLESLGIAVIGAAFMVPAALGVQEGGFMLLAAAVGLPPEVGLALSLAKRVRELTVGLPGLLAWQVAEGRRLLRRSWEKAGGGGPPAAGGAAP